MSNKIVNNVKKIVVLRANALGDFVVTLPAFNALRQTYPTAEIVLLGKPWHKEYLIPNRSPINRVIVVPAIKGLRDEDYEDSENDIELFYKTIVAENFDIAIHFQGEGKSANPFLNRLGARLTVGMSGKGLQSLDRHISFIYYQSEVLRYLEIVSLIGAYTKDYEPHLTVFGNEIEKVKEVIPNDFIVIHPAAADVRRMWSTGKFAQVADYLSQKGFNIVITGTQAEKKIATQVITQMQTKAINLVGKLTLAQLSAVLSLSTAVIANDTGPLHLARAVGTKTLGLYWGPNLLNWGPLTRNKHRAAISWEITCPHCGIKPVNPWPFEPQLKNCTHRVSFIDSITTDTVISTIEELL